MEEVNGKTYQCCKYHVAWIIRDPKAPRHARFRKKQQISDNKNDSLSKEVSNIVTTVLINLEQ